MESFINYNKSNNKKLFENFSNFGITQTQNYLPIYKLFFDLNETNFNKINLNHSSKLVSIDRKTESLECSVVGNISCNDIIRQKKIFVKKAPVIDPYYYVMGKYKFPNEELIKLPDFSCNNEKLSTPYNSSYVDGFFSYLSNQLLKQFGVIHGIEFYGSYLSISPLKVNVIEDIDYLIKSEYFLKNQNILFQIDDYSHIYTHPKKLPPINIVNDGDKIELDDISYLPDNNIGVLQIDETLDLQQMDVIEKESNELSESGELEEVEHTFEMEESIASTNNTDTTYSSRSSYTTIDSREEMDLSDGDDTLSNDGSFSSFESISSNEEEIFIHLDRFPVHLICTEKCEDTLDTLINNNEIDKDEWFPILLQVIFTLIIYQKCFHFTHNDLHTENIMFVKTEIKHLYYIFNNKTYKVPTYGKIFKIIDFGRSIFKVKGKTIVSDEFKQGGNAYGQYNCEPFLNDKKPRIEPNYSFDLCRLGCCIFDYLVEDLEDLDRLCKNNPVIKLITEWCRDDNNLLINYKNNGKERYSGFKYYKMIALKVHKHLPIVQLKRKEFTKFETKKIPNNCYKINIDSLHSLV